MKLLEVTYRLLLLPLPGCCCPHSKGSCLEGFCSSHLTRQKGNWVVLHLHHLHTFSLLKVRRENNERVLVLPNAFSAQKDQQIKADKRLDLQDNFVLSKAVISLFSLYRLNTFHLRFDIDSVGKPGHSITLKFTCYT